MPYLAFRRLLFSISASSSARTPLSFFFLSSFFGAGAGAAFLIGVLRTTFCGFACLTGFFSSLISFLTSETFSFSSLSLFLNVFFTSSSVCAAIAFSSLLILSSASETLFSSCFFSATSTFLTIFSTSFTASFTSFFCSAISFFSSLISFFCSATESTILSNLICNLAFTSGSVDAAIAFLYLSIFSAFSTFCLFSSAIIFSSFFSIAVSALATSASKEVTFACILLMMSGSVDAAIAFLYLSIFSSV